MSCVQREVIHAKSSDFGVDDHMITDRLMKLKCDCDLAEWSTIISQPIKHITLLPMSFNKFWIDFHCVKIMLIPQAWMPFKIANLQMIADQILDPCMIRIGSQSDWALSSFGSSWITVIAKISCHNQIVATFLVIAIPFAIIDQWSALGSAIISDLWNDTPVMFKNTKFIL